MSPAILCVLQCVLNRRFAVRQIIKTAQKSNPNRDNVANIQLVFFESLNAFIKTIRDDTNKIVKSVGTRVLSSWLVISIFL